MTAPKRWLDDPGAGLASERELLRAGLSLEPPPGSGDAIWAALAPQLPPGGGVGGPSGPSGSAASAARAAGKAAAGAAGAKVVAGTAASVKATTVVAGGGILKSMLLGAGAAVAVIGAYSVVVPTEPTERAVPTATVAAATAAPVEAPSAVPQAVASAASTVAPAEPPAEASASADVPIEGRPSSRAPSDPSRAVASAGSPVSEAALAERATRLREESRMLSEAREDLRRGDVGGASKKLDEAFVKFPDGMLGQEREALTIEALYKSGRRDAAKARAAAFLRAFPKSAHAVRIQAFAE